jgi:uncharacterized protein (UPF0335 family)
MIKSTMVELVAELEATGFQSLGLRTIITEAKAGEFHDYKNQKYATPKAMLIGLLVGEAARPATPKVVREALRAIIERIKDGEFDEQADQEDLEAMRKTTPRSMWPMLGL